MRARGFCFGLHLAAAAGIVLDITAGCAINPATGKPQLVLMSEAREVELGRKAAAQVSQEVGLVDDPELAEYVDAIGQRLVRVSVHPEQRFEFQVVDMQEPNAFALPGGHVYVSRGLLAISNTEDELANVLGHEIGHVLARHAAQRETRALPGTFLTGLTALAVGIVGGGQAAALVGSIGQTATSGLLAGYSRDQEREADKLGQELAARAGYSPAGMAEFLATLERATASEAKGSRRPSFFDSHPSTPERVSTTENFARQLSVLHRERPLPEHPRRFSRRSTDWILGVDARQGIFEEATFLHPDLAFHIRFPDGWKTSNGKTAVGAISPAQDAVVALEFQARGTDPRAVAETFVAEQRIVVSQSGALVVSGLAAFRVLGVAQTQRGGLPLMLTFIAYREVIYRVTGLASSSVLHGTCNQSSRRLPRASVPFRRPSAHGILQNAFATCQCARRRDDRTVQCAHPECLEPGTAGAIVIALEPETRLEGDLAFLKFARQEPLSASPRAAGGKDGPSPLGGAAEGTRRPAGNR